MPVLTAAIVSSAPMLLAAASRGWASYTVRPGEPLTAPTSARWCARTTSAPAAT